MGFATMAMMAFLPALVAALVALAIVLIAVHQKMAIEKFCRVETLRLQHELSVPLNALVKLNRLASRLRALHVKAEAALALALASGVPPWIASARARVDAVEMEQRALAAKQNILLLQARSSRLAAARNLHKYVDQAGIQSIRASSLSDALAVRALPAGSLSPSYVPEVNFADRQSETLRYSYSLNSILPDWLRSGFSAVSAAGACSATLQKEKEWKPKMREAKP